ncbi:hypothetical protein JXI42_05195 [bacterium]|nr:hypothetical protein [bacterium]
MKRWIVFFAILALFSTFFINCEDETVEPEPEDNSEWLRIGESILPGIMDIEIVEGDVAWIVGMDGFMAKTSNRGVDWDTLSLTGLWETLFDIDFTSSKAWICGQQGVLLKSENGGDDWEQVYIPDFYHYDSTVVDSTILESFEIIDTNNIIFNTNSYSYTVIDTSLVEFEDIDLYDIEFSDANNGFIAASRGIIYRTSDGGETWRGGYAKDSVDYDLYTYSVICTTLVFIDVDSLGADTTYFEVVFNDTNFYTIYTVDNSALFGACYWTNDNWWVVGFDRTLLYSSNMGNNWHRKHEMAEESQLNDILFVNEMEGWAVGEGGMILKTVDGGETWSAVTGHDCRQNLNEIRFFTGDEIGWCAGDDRAVLYTGDGGATWERQYSDLEANFNSIGIVTDESAERWLVGYRPSARVGTILYTEDDGEEWDIQSYGIRRSLASVFFLDELNGWVVGSDGVCCQSTDGGQTWVHQNSQTTNYINSVYFHDTNNGWIAGNDGIFRKTTDGGFHWVTIDVGTGSRLYKIAFPTAEVGYIVGEDGVILKSADGGDSWTALTIPSEISDVYFRDLFFVTENEGWVCGDNGTVIHTINGGDSWTPQESNTITNLLGIHFISATEGWVVGGIDGGVSRVHHTVDGGENWVYQSTGESIWWSDVFFTDANNGWVTGLYGKIYHTSDGGESWHMQVGEASGNLSEIYFANSNPDYGWAVGSNGVILKYYPEE